MTLTPVSPAPLSRRAKDPLPKVSTRSRWYKSTEMLSLMEQERVRPNQKHKVYNCVYYVNRHKVGIRIVLDLQVQTYHEMLQCIRVM